MISARAFKTGVIILLIWFAGVITWNYIDANYDVFGSKPDDVFWTITPEDLTPSLEKKRYVPHLAVYQRQQRIDATSRFLATSAWVVLMLSFLFFYAITKR